MSLVFALGFISQGYAIDNEQRIMNSYVQTDKAFDLECYYHSPIKNLLVLPTAKSIYRDQKIVRSFNLTLDEKSIDMTVSLLQKSNDDKGIVGKYKASIGDNQYSGSVESNFEKGFYLKNSGTDFDNKFEVEKLYCLFNVARTAPFEFNNSHTDIHINVHPHQIYDNFNETTENVQRMLNENFGKNIMLIEERNNAKGQIVDLSSFLETGIVPDLPKNTFATPIDIPLTTELLISPAGHNRYSFAKKDGEVNITFTGGFHNYCVWNNTRNILRGLFRSESNAKLVINYKLDSLIVQKDGIMSMFSFKRRHVRNTKLLSNIMAADPAYMKNYFKNYFIYFTNGFLNYESWGNFRSTFKTLKVDYKSPLFNDVAIIKGSGTRDLEIDFNYL